MSAKLQITTRVRRLIDYIVDIEKGLIQIPAFQRDFIWNNNDKIELFNSLKMGYPIGSILFWQPTESYGYLPTIGPYTVPVQKENYFYILDGFQRLSTLFGCLINPYKTLLKRDIEKWQKDFQICYDLDKEEFFIPRKTKSSLEFYQIPVYKLIDTRESFNFQRELFDKGDDLVELYLGRFEEIGNTLLGFNLPSIDINGGEINEAIDIFWRLNSKGSTISQDWIVSARTYNSQNDFRLGTEIDNLLYELGIYNFGEIKRELILQCIQSSFGKIYLQEKIDDLVKKPEFITTTRTTIINIKKAVKFLFEELFVIDNRLLPANIQLVFLTEFFNKIDDPSDQQLDTLKDWFWKTTYSNCFTIYSPSKRENSFITFQRYLSGLTNDPFYNDSDVPFSVGTFPNKIFFGSVRAKALTLFLINYSNNFESVLSEEVDSFKLSNLFSNYRNDNDDFPSENAIPLINWREPVFPKTKDMSFLLEDHYEDWYGKFFLTEEMRLLLEQNNKEEILNLRKRLIMLAEKSFVESLGLVYEE